MVAIAVLDDYQNVARTFADWSRVDAAHKVTVFNVGLGSEAAAADVLSPFDVVCVMRERMPVTAGLIAKLPNLKLLVTTGHRNASIDMAACAARSIVVCGTNAPGHATAELAAGLMLALARNIPFENQALRSGAAWQTTVGIDLNGKTLGILGLGRLGSTMARIGQAFRMNVIAWSENLTPERAKECGAERVDKDALLARSDVLTIHTRLSARTRGLIGRRELALMKPTALLINTSRGPIVEEAALIEALRAGKLRGAGLDTYDVEPLPLDHPLRSTPRLVLTPHLGYVTEETYVQFYQGTVAAIEGWLAGKPVHVITD